MPPSLYGLSRRPYGPGSQTVVESARPANASFQQCFRSVTRFPLVTAGARQPRDPPYGLFGPESLDEMDSMHRCSQDTIATLWWRVNTGTAWCIEIAADLSRAAGAVQSICTVSERGGRVPRQRAIPSDICLAVSACRYELE